MACRQPSYQYDLSTAACGFSREELRPVHCKPSSSQRRHQGHNFLEYVNTYVRINGRIEVHMRAPVEIIMACLAPDLWGNQKLTTSSGSLYQDRLAWRFTVSGPLEGRGKTGRRWPRVIRLLPALRHHHCKRTIRPCSWECNC